MADVGFALEAKSDQLNAVDIMGYEPIIRVREVKVRSSDQPIAVYFDGDNNKPWKPSKGMARILGAAWGRESDNWVGKHAQLFFEPTVRYAGVEVGGIRIRALSDIPEKGLTFALALSKQKREPYLVQYLKAPSNEYPADKFKAALPAMTDAMAAGKMTLQQVIARCQQTGTLTTEQLAQLEQAAPVEPIDIANDNEEEEF